MGAFGLDESESGTEQVVVVAETRARSREEREKIEADVIERVATATGGPPDIVRLAPPGSVLKTSSGKIRRNDTRALYLSGALGRARGDSGLTRLKLAGRAARGALDAMISRLSLGLRGVALFATLFAYAPVAWVVLRFLNPRQARSFERASARLALRLLTPDAFLSGAETLAQWEGPALLVCNHASYLDVIVLRALVPSDFVFVAKREALSYPLVSSYLRAAGHICVERFDAQQGASDVSQVTQVLKQGMRVLVFPEGTFTHADGIRPFRLGAFKSAADAGCPVIPLAIRGTRKMLRGAQIVPRRGSIAVRIGAPVTGSGDSFRDLVAFRDRVRAIIGAEAGEVLLEMVSAGIQEP